MEICKDIPYYSSPNVHIYGLLAEQCMLFSYVPFGVVVKVPDCPDSLQDHAINESSRGQFRSNNSAREAVPRLIESGHPVFYAASCCVLLQVIRQDAQRFVSRVKV
jgi:hypothetical protein